MTGTLAIPTSYWEQLADPPSQRFEVLEGRIIVSAVPRPIHRGLVHRLANFLVEVCPPDYRAVCDIEWRTGTPDQVTNALRPDVTGWRWTGPSPSDSSPTTCFPGSC
jgi:hypothetical protein